MSYNKDSFKQRLTLFKLLLIPTLLLSGCMQLPADYRPGETMRMSAVEEATVVSMREVSIGGRSRNYGQLIGGVLGAIAGADARPTHSWSQTAAAVVGTTVGAIIGDNVEDATRKQVGTEYVLTLANGKTVSIVQEGKKPGELKVGDSVRITRSGRYARIIP